MQRHGYAIAMDFFKKELRQRISVEASLVSIDSRDTVVFDFLWLKWKRGTCQAVRTER